MTIRVAEAVGVTLSDRLMQVLGMGVSVERARLQVVLDGVCCAETREGTFVLRPGDANLRPRISDSCDIATGTTLEVDFESPAEVAPSRFTLDARSRQVARVLATAVRTTSSWREIRIAYTALRLMLESCGVPIPALDETGWLPRETDTLRALDRVLGDLPAAPASVDLEDMLGCTRRTVVRRVNSLNSRLGLHGLRGGRDFRATRDFYRLSVAGIALSAADATTDSVSRDVGFASPVSLCHAFHRVGLPSPGSFRLGIRADTANLV